MALLIKKFLDMYSYAKDDMADPRTNDWFMVKSPIAIMFIMILYLVIVQEIGPKLMESRKPFELRKTLIVYNIVQIFLSSYVLIGGFPVLLKYASNDIFCAEVDYSNNENSLKVAHLTWCYFMTKFIDFLDTIFFVLRKKNNQASFLHVYHHFGMFFVGWLGTKYIAGGESVYLGVINSFVHVIMYSYYLYSSFDKGNTNRIWWKKHITQLQLVQFIVLFFKYLPVLLNNNCGFPKAILIFYFPQNISMIVLFGDFYYKTYIKKPKKLNN